jgi:uncharacterized protein (DUF2235 family)
MDHVWVIGAHELSKRHALWHGIGREDGTKNSFHFVLRWKLFSFGKRLFPFGFAKRSVDFRLLNGFIRRCGSW